MAGRKMEFATSVNNDTGGEFLSAADRPKSGYDRAPGGGNFGSPTPWTNSPPVSMVGPPLILFASWSRRACALQCGNHPAIAKPTQPAEEARAEEDARAEHHHARRLGDDLCDEV